jgi:hypothetical protein
MLERRSRSMNTLSIQRPRPSIEMRVRAAIGVPANAALVNWLPWSVLKMSGPQGRNRRNRGTVRGAAKFFGYEKGRTKYEDPNFAHRPPLAARIARKHIRC